MRELHLFAGIGGGILGGMLLGHTTVCAVEIDPYCRRVIEARQLEGLLPSFPILEDVRQFDAREWRGKVDVVCGGFPCQPWSQAGKRLGAADPRHLWPEMARIIGECRPAFVFAENVSLAAFEEPWRDLRGMGYRVPPAVCIAAADLGAPHIRKRWWMLAADSDSKQHQGGASAQWGPTTKKLPTDADRCGMHELDARQHVAGASGIPPAAWRDGSEGHVANTHSSRLAERQGERGHDGEERAATVRTGWWTVEPRVGGTFDGLSSWLDRSGWITESHKLLLAYGNATKKPVAEVVRSMRDDLRAAHIQWEAGGRECLPASSVLFAYVCELARRCDSGGIAMASAEATGTGLRSVWITSQLARASRRWESEQQRRSEHSDALHALSQLLARDAESAWLCYRRENATAIPHWEDGIARVAHGVPSRVDRLRALGNAQVPAVAAAAFRHLMHANFSIAGGR